MVSVVIHVTYFSRMHTQRAIIIICNSVRTETLMVVSRCERGSFSVALVDEIALLVRLSATFES